MFGGSLFGVYEQPVLYGTVVVDTTFTSGLNLDGGGSDDRAYIRCTFNQSVGNGNTAVQLRDVDHILFAYCEMDASDTTGNGWPIQFRGTGSTGCSDVIVKHNKIHHARSDGIIIAVDNADRHEHTDIEILRNEIYACGLDQTGSGKHGIYDQSWKGRIIENWIHGVNWGNGISLRVGCIVLRNIIEDVRRPDTGDPMGIKYFSNHDADTNEDLIIEENIIDFRSITGESGRASYGSGDAGEDEVNSIILTDNETITYAGDSNNHYGFDPNHSGILVESGNFVTQEDPSVKIISQSTATVGSNETSITVDTPDGSFNWLVAIVHTDGNTVASFTKPDEDWSIRVSDNINGGDNSLFILTKKITGSEPSDYTFSWSPTERSTVVIYRVEGNADDIFDFWSSDTSTAESTTHSISAIEANVDNSLALLIGASEDATSNNTIDTGTLLTQIDTGGGDSFNSNLTVMEMFLRRATSGPTPVATFTVPSAKRACVGTLVLLPTTGGIAPIRHHLNQLMAA